MKATYFAVAMSLIGAPCLAVEGIAVVQGTGERIQVKQDGTWALIEGPAAQSESVPELTALPRTPDEALKITETNLELRHIDYRDTVTFNMGYQNKSAKKIVGIVTNVSFANAFGKVVHSQDFRDETVVEPGQTLKPDGYWTFKNNPFIADEIYDRMWQGVKNGTIKTTTKIVKIVFDDGSSLEPKRPKKSK
ncbi:MAG: hypothetical protein ABFE08_01175 [Armatimonadia bacterium]